MHILFSYLTLVTKEFFFKFLLGVQNQFNLSENDFIKKVIAGNFDAFLITKNVPNICQF